MPGIKYNLLTKEIEFKGSKSFIESNINKIQDLLVESIGVKKVTALRQTKIKQEPISVIKMKESRAGAEIKGHNLPGASPILPAAKSLILQFSHEIKAKRPPVRKYIRSVGIPGQQRIVVEVAEQKRNEISIASLREKFGLSKAKIEGVIRDAEKQGKIRRSMNGSYSWAQD
jgi:hypothetical protein